MSIILLAIYFIDFQFKMFKPKVDFLLSIIINILSLSLFQLYRNVKYLYHAL